MYKFLLFDIDDTLLDFHKSLLFALIKTFKDHGVNLTDEMIEDYVKINDFFWSKFEKHEIEREVLLVERFRIYFTKWNLDLDNVSFNKEYLNNIADNPYLMDNALTVLNDLKDDYDIYLVSNGVKEVQTKRLHLTGVDRLVKGVFVSEDLGYNKPDPRYFEKVFNSIPNFKKENALLIGDSLTSDIKGANNVGLSCCYFKHNDKDYSNYKIDYIITNLNELYDILR